MPTTPSDRNAGSRDKSTTNGDVKSGIAFGITELIIYVLIGLFGSGVLAFISR